MSDDHLVVDGLRSTEATGDMAEQVGMLATQAQFLQALHRISILEQQTRAHQQAAAAAAAHAAQLEQELGHERASTAARDMATQDVMTVLCDAVQRPSARASNSGLGKGLGPRSASLAWTRPGRTGHSLSRATSGPSRRRPSR